MTNFKLSKKVILFGILVFWTLDVTQSESSPSLSKKTNVNSNKPQTLSNLEKINDCDNKNTQNVSPLSANENNDNNNNIVTTAKPKKKSSKKRNHPAFVAKPTSGTMKKQKNQGTTTKAKTKTKVKAVSTEKVENGSKKQSQKSVSSTLRRIKREYKDAVAMGIAYDWVNQKPVTPKKKKKQPLQDASEISVHDGNDNDTPPIRLGPLTSNLRHWHFSFVGYGVYAHGVYHGRIMLPKNYPASPPRVQLWTPSGRFVVGRDICLSASAYHPETWTPRWTVLSLVQALRLHMVTNPQEIGGKTSSYDLTMEHAKNSQSWKVKFNAGKLNVVVDHKLMIQEQKLFNVTNVTATTTTIDTSNIQQQDKEEKEVDSSEHSQVLVANNDEPKKGPLSVFQTIISLITSPTRLLLLSYLILLLILNLNTK